MIHRFFLEPYELAFMQRALVEVLLLGALGGMVGVHVVLRRMTFFAEALQHTVFPGIAIAFVTGQSLLLGAVVAAALTVVLQVMLTTRSRIDPDALLAVLVAGFFALGVVVVSHRSGYASDLNQLLFGRILGVDARQIVETAAVAAVVAAALLGVHKELVLAALDREQAAGLGYPVTLLDLALHAALAATVVVAVRAVGTVLVVAFVVTPAATARLVTRSVGSAMAVAAALGALLGWVGLSVSYEASVHHGVRLASGATVVLVFTLAFVVVGAGSLVVRRAQGRVAA